MITKHISINIPAVYLEVAKTTSYIGKKSDDVTAYERVFTADEDAEQLDRFWSESRAEVSQQLIRFVESEEEVGDDYNLALALSDSFDPALLDSMRANLFNYFVSAILSKWFAIANKNEAEAYGAQAKALLEDVKIKACHKKAPTRPTY